MQCRCSGCNQRFYWTGDKTSLLKLFCGKCGRRHTRDDLPEYLGGQASVNDQILPETIATRVTNMLRANAS